MDGTYLLDAGAERLVSEWKYQRGHWVDKHAGVDQGAPDPSYDHIYYNNGSAKFKPDENLKTLKLRILVDTLAPIESDGPEDNDEWTLFKQYLHDNSEEE